jgi:streptogramin lyase
VQAEIATGLQPQWLHAAFGSLWVSNHHGASATRIDPITNRVQDTVQVGAPDTFRDGPQAITDDGTRLYVGSSNLQALQSVDPATDAVSTPPSIADAFCGPTEAAGGFVWSVDRCTATTYRLGTDGSVQQAIASTGMPQGLTTAGGDVWIGDDTTFDPNSGVGSSAVLDERDASTGVLLQSVPIGGDASDLASGFGSLWVYDAVASTIRRVQV